MTSTIALIVDIVGSRAVANRVDAQQAVRDAFARADLRFAPEQHLWATVGDEFQARYADLGSALGATALARLILPEGIDCRFGLGIGEAKQVESTGDGRSIQDGPAWWRARDAILAVHRLQDTSQPSARTWLESDDPRLAAAVDALLLQRDQAISRMKARERRLTAGTLEGRTQKELAQEERIAQPAVSQALHRSGGAALTAGIELFGKLGAA